MKEILFQGRDPDGVDQDPDPTVGFDRQENPGFDRIKYGSGSDLLRNTDSDPAPQPCQIPDFREIH